MSEGETETHVGGGAGSVLSGVFNGPVTNWAGPEVRELAQALIEEYGPRHASVAIGVQTAQRLVELETLLARRFEREDAERLLRQEDTDRHRARIDARLDNIERRASASLVAGAAALVTSIAAWLRGRS